MVDSKTKYGVGAAGIQSLEIRGTVNGDLDKFALIANRNQLIASGKEDYVLSVRESLLGDKVRKFRIPEIWDRQWTYKLGPIWTPLSATASTCELWLNPEGMETNDAGDRVTTCIDASGNNRNFSQSNTSDQPEYSAKNSSANNFRAMTALNSADQLNASLGTGIDHDTTQDWCWGFVAILQDQHANSGVNQCTMAYNGNTIGNGSGNNEFSCVFRYNTLDANERFQLRKFHDGTSGANPATFTYNPDITFNANQPQIVIIGRTNGASFFRLNGTAESSQGTDSRAHTAQGVDGGWGGGYQSSNTRGFQDPMFEWVVLNGTGTTGAINTDVEKLEGYFAQKYGLLDLLPAGHTYKSDAPRASITV